MIQQTYRFIVPSWLGISTILMLLNTGVYQKAIANTTSQNTSAVIVSQAQLTAEQWLKRGDERDNAKDAIADYTQAIKLKPDYADAYLRRGSIRHFIQKDYAGAIADYDRAIKLRPRPKDMSIYSNSGNAHAALVSDFQKAAKLYQANNKTEEYERTLKQLKELQSTNSNPKKK